MIRSAVTVSLVNEARGGPFVFWDDLPAACASAEALGFDAIELFAPSPTAVVVDELKSLLHRHHLSLAAVGTGAGMVKHGLNLTDLDSSKRQAAQDFIRSMIDYGSNFGAPAIIGSMQGRWGGSVDRDQALDWLRTALNELGEHAKSRGVPLIYEPQSARGSGGGDRRRGGRDAGNAGETPIPGAPVDVAGVGALGGSEPGLQRRPDRRE